MVQYLKEVMTIQILAIIEVQKAKNGFFNSNSLEVFNIDEKTWNRKYR